MIEYYHTLLENKMKNLFILNAQPYGTEHSYNGLRLAGAIAKDTTQEVKVFLMGDAASCAKSGQKVPDGFYNIELMIKRLARVKDGLVGVCGTCMDARGIKTEELIEGTHRGTLDELANWSIEADKVFVF